MPPVERYVRAQRTARVYQIGATDGSAKELWIACHGYGQLAATFALTLEPLRDDRRIILVPEALSRFYIDDPMKRHGPESPVGASWMTREDRQHEIDDYVRYLDLVASTARAEIGHDVPVVGFGFSQGVATISRWAAMGSCPLRRLILWGGSLPIDLPADFATRLRGAEVVIAGGRRDKVVAVESLERDRASLVERGVSTELRLHDGGHTLNAELLRQIPSAQ